MPSQNFFTNIIDKIRSVWNGSLTTGMDGEDVSYVRREKIVVFIVCFVLALCLWLLVNLSRDFNLNVNLPIILGNIPNNEALASDLPDFATVSVKGEGWKLINVYNNPPKIYVDVSQDEVNLYDQVREQMNAVPDVSVLKVQPLILNVDLEKKGTKKVAVKPDVDVSFDEQYNFIEDPYVEPDTVTISGAESRIANIQSVSTQHIELSGIDANINREVSLKKPNNLVNLSQQNVIYKAKVAEFTEGEVKVYVRTRDIPDGRNVSYSPAMISIKYDVPIQEYARSQDQDPFNAYVFYSEIERDSTGFVTPHIEKTVNNLHLKLRSYQPQRVAYYNVLSSK